MSIPSSPAPSYQPDKYSNQTKILLKNHKAFPNDKIRRVASVPSTVDYFHTTTATHLPHSSPSSPRPSYSLDKQTVQVGPEDFEKVRLLGKGDVGKVYLVKHKETSQLYALKGKIRRGGGKRKN